MNDVTHPLVPIATSKHLVDYIRAVAPEYGLNPGLCVAQCRAESSLRLNVPDSPKGAVGVMQLMPIALKDLRQRWGMDVDPHQPKESVRGAMTLMRWLKSHYLGDMRKALAAYNLGVGDLDGTIHLYGRAWESHVPRETRDYVARICGALDGVAVELPRAA